MFCGCVCILLFNVVCVGSWCCFVCFGVVLCSLCVVGVCCCGLLFFVCCCCCVVMVCACFAVFVVVKLLAAVIAVGVLFIGHVFVCLLVVSLLLLLYCEFVCLCCFLSMFV